MRSTFPFPHNKLEVFGVSKEMVRLANAVAARVPRGTARLPTT